MTLQLCCTTSRSLGGFVVCATITPMQKIVIHTDGGARGNPGPAGIGVVYYDEAGEELHTLSEFLGDATNNVAEYTALVLFFF